MKGLVTLAEAAARLTELGDRISRGKVRTYCERNGIRLQEGNGRTFVSLADLVNHRRSNPRLGSASHGLPAIDAEGSEQWDAAADYGLTERAAPPPRISPAEEEARQRKTLADAMLKELELARRQGLLLDRMKVEETAANAIEGARSVMLASMNQTAEQIAEVTRTEPRRIRPLLRKMVDDAFADLWGRLAEKRAG